MLLDPFSKMTGTGHQLLYDDYLVQVVSVENTLNNQYPDSQQCPNYIGPCTLTLFGHGILVSKLKATNDILY